VSETSASVLSKLVHEGKQLFWIAVYFWILIGLFTVFKALVLHDENLVFHQGFAVINAWILAKVVLVAEYFQTAENWKEKPLIYPIVLKAAVFCVLLLGFYVLEETAVGLWKGKSVAASVPNVGGGTIRGYIVVSLILFVALLPFFFYRELARVLGADKLHALLFSARS